MTAMGLDAYGKRTGEFQVVVNDGRVGCGIDQGGERRFDGHDFVLAKFCGDLFQQWTAAVTGHPIDVAVIQTGLWEVVERKIPGDQQWRTVGDPVLDAYMAGQLRAATEFWTSRGVPVVWLRAPAPDYLERNPDAMVRFNQLIVQVVAAAPAATTVPLDAFLTGLSEADRARLRPDGVHFDGGYVCAGGRHVARRPGHGGGDQGAARHADGGAGAAAPAGGGAELSGHQRRSKASTATAAATASTTSAPARNRVLPHDAMLTSTESTTGASSSARSRRWWRRPSTTKPAMASARVTRWARWAKVCQSRFRPSSVSMATCPDGSHSPQVRRARTAATPGTSVAWSLA